MVKQDLATKLKLLGWNKKFLGIMLLLPAMVFIVGVILYPLLSTLFMAFKSMDLLKPGAGTPFVGLDNFKWLFNWPHFPISLINSIVLTLASTGGQVIIALLLAILFNEYFAGRKILRGFLILPWAIPTYVASIVWKWLLDANYGIINLLFLELGIFDQPIDWYGNIATAMPTVIVSHIWKGLPWVFLVILAGLQTINEEHRESAAVDGATGWQTFMRVILPQLRYIIGIAFLLRAIWYFNWFDFVYLLTGGGPANQTMILPIAVYNIAFEGYRFGRGAAISTFMFLILAIFVVVYLNLTFKEEKI